MHGEYREVGLHSELILSVHPLTICVCLFPILSPCCPFMLPLPLLLNLSSSISMGAASQWIFEVGEKKKGKPGVLKEHDGPWGWAERWGTDRGVCDKRMSFTANDSHRGDQLLSLQRLTYVPLPCRIDSAKKKQTFQDLDTKEHRNAHTLTQ